MILLWLVIFLELHNIQAKKDPINEEVQEGSGYHYPKFLHLDWPMKWNDWHENVTIPPWHENRKDNWDENRSDPEQEITEKPGKNEGESNIYGRLARMREEIATYENRTLARGDIFKVMELIEKFLKALEKVYNDFMDKLERESKNELIQSIVAFACILCCGIFVFCCIKCRESKKVEHIKVEYAWIEISKKRSPFETKKFSSPIKEAPPYMDVNDREDGLVSSDTSQTSFTIPEYSSV